MSMELCEKIAAEVQRKNKSLTRVMAAADLSVSVFYRWKEGKSKPRPKSLKAIAAALGIPASALDSELSDDVAVTASATPLPMPSQDSEDLSEMKFFGLARSDYNALAPFIAALKARVVEVPENLNGALQNLIERATLLLTFESSLTLDLS